MGVLVFDADGIVLVDVVLLQADRTVASDGGIATAWGVVCDDSD